MTTAPRMLALVLCSGAALAQATPEVGGRVLSADGQPVAGARIDFLPLELRALPRRGLKGVYTFAQTRHRAQVKLPRTATDRGGRWRVLLSTQQAALTLAGSVELEMRVRAPGYATWRRAIGPDVIAANAVDVRLEAPGPGLSLTLSAPKGAARGYVLIERPFRVRGSQSILLRDLLPIADDGRVRFAEPARVPGELAPNRATARAEGYRVSVFAAGMAKLTAVLPEGEHRLVLEPSDYGSRRILAERAEPARPPIELTYTVAGYERTLTSTEATAPVLGDEVPTRIETGSGPVEIDSWDPDLPMFVERPGDRAAAEAQDPADRAVEPRRDGVLRVDVVDRRKQPLFGAGVWIENQGVAEAATDAPVFGLTNARGRVELRGLPPGSYRVLVRHPLAGERETLATIAADPPPQQVRLRARPEQPSMRPPLEGTMLLDLSAFAADQPLEVGMLTADRRVARRRFDDVPRTVRLEGLVPGPSDFYLRLGDAPPMFFGGVLAKTVRDAAVVIKPPGSRRYLLTARDPEGKPEAGVYLSLGEGSLPDKRPFSAALFSVKPLPQPGQHVVEVAVHGSLWLRAHGAAGAAVDLQLTPTDDASADIPIEVDLRAAPEKPGAPTETIKPPDKGPEKGPDKTREQETVS